MTIFKDSSQLKNLSSSGRLIGIDVGTKRIGIAISDQSRFIATPKLVLKRQSNLKDFVKISEIITENAVVAIVIGLPINLDNSASEMSKFVEKFSENFDEFLERRFPIFLFDERLSSFEAREINSSKLSRKKDGFYDDIAASLILQHFLSDTEMLLSEVIG